MTGANKPDSLLYDTREIIELPFLPSRIKSDHLHVAFCLTGAEHWRAEVGLLF